MSDYEENDYDLEDVVDGVTSLINIFSGNDELDRQIGDMAEIIDAAVEAETPQGTADLLRMFYSKLERIEEVNKKYQVAMLDYLAATANYLYAWCLCVCDPDAEEVKTIHELLDSVNEVCQEVLGIEITFFTENTDLIKTCKDWSLKLIEAGINMRSQLAASLGANN